MRTSPSDFRDSVRDRILALAWRQWSSIGVPGYSDATERRVVDPEALLVLTMTVGRHDMRLFDEVLIWLRAYGPLLNAQRLQGLVGRSDAITQATLAAVADRLTQNSAIAPKWKGLASRWSLAEPIPLFLLGDGHPLPRPQATDDVFRRHGLLRAPIPTIEADRPFPSRGDASLLLRLRALLGVTLRCEILCVLGSVDEIHPSRLADSLALSPRSVQKTLAEMALSGAVQVRSEARLKYYSLTSGVLDPLLRAAGPTPWRHSVPLLRACGLLWQAASDPALDRLEPSLLASQWRRVSHAIAPDLADAGCAAILRSPQSYPGEAYYDVFIEDVARFLEAV